MVRLIFGLVLLAGPASAQDVRILPGFSDFLLPEARVFDTLTDLLPTYALSLPESLEGGVGQELTLTEEQDALVVTFTDAGGGDDSVQAVQIRYVLEQNDAWQWELKAYGHRQKCWRDQSDGWTDGPCP